MPKQYHQHVSWSWFHSFFALSKKCWVYPQHGGRVRGHNSVVCMTHKCDARPHIILSSIFSIPKSLHFEYLFKIFNSRRPGWLKNQLCIFSACKLFLLDRRVPLQNSCVLHPPLKSDRVAIPSSSCIAPLEATQCNRLGISRLPCYVFVFVCW